MAVWPWLTPDVLKRHHVKLETKVEPSQYFFSSSTWLNHTQTQGELPWVTRTSKAPPCVTKMP
ncbi:hypothetical protein J1614_010153 [Plenodomus biglobosus]|nr:hypothetical protein J1614_010153 [Plenodomus biglobosus]